MTFKQKNPKKKTNAWKQTSNGKEYKVWIKDHENVRDVLVARTETNTYSGKPHREWVTFMHRGFEGRQGKENIYSGKSKIQALKKAKSYREK